MSCYLMVVSGFQCRRRGTSLGHQVEDSGSVMTSLTTSRNAHLFLIWPEYRIEDGSKSDSCFLASR